MNELQVHQGGVSATIQDLGRWNFRSAGVALGGAMDRSACQAANILVGNPATDAVLEITLHGTVVSLSQPALIAVTGGDLKPMVGDVELPMNRPLVISAETKIRFERAQQGVFAYLAVSGGFAVAKVLGGYGTHLQSRFGGYHGRAIRAADRIAIGIPTTISQRIAQVVISGGLGRVGRYASWGWAPPTRKCWHVPTSLRLIPGLHWQQLTAASRQAIFNQTFRVDPRCNRMGYRLQGAPLSFGRPLEIHSMPTVIGTVQLPADGQPIVLMADAAPTGGYPQIGYIASVDVGELAQRSAGDEIRFVESSVDQARATSAAAALDLKKLAVAVSLQALTCSSGRIILE